ncbi:MAG TPA: hypothetical protein VKB38_09405 [Terracidiphilus sp.]|nr:hypothetical protein [Terracidiphilus sp.]
MQILSAAEAISPALNRTKRLLFQPFRFGTFLKLCAVAVVTEGFSGNWRFNDHSSVPQAGHSNTMFAWNPNWVVGFAAIAIASVILGFVLLYLVVRLRFALFNCLIHQTPWIRPGWRMYGEQARRFYLLSIWVGIVYFAAAVAALLPFADRLFRLFKEGRLVEHTDWAALIPIALQLAPVILVLMIAALAIDVILRDFMLPHIALENATVGDAWSAVVERIATEKGSFVLYALLRIMLPMVAYIGLFIVLVIPTFLVFMVPGALIAAVHAVTVNASAGVAAVGIFFEVVLGAALVALGILLAIGCGGPLCVAIRNYALVFYGGRYKALGDVLYPPAPLQPPTTA